MHKVLSWMQMQQVTFAHSEGASLNELDIATRGKPSEMHFWRKQALKTRIQTGVFDPSFTKQVWSWLGKTVPKSTQPKSSSHLCFFFCPLCSSHLQNPSPINAGVSLSRSLNVLWHRRLLLCSPDQLKYVISRAAKVRKSNKAEDYSLTSLPKSLGGHSEHWRAPSQSGDPCLRFYKTLIMGKGAGTCQTSLCESSTLALLQSTALWPEQRVAFNCRRVVTNGFSWLYRPLIRLIFLQLGCKFNLVVADMAKKTYKFIFKKSIFYLDVIIFMSRDDFSLFSLF